MTFTFFQVVSNNRSDSAIEQLKVLSAVETMKMCIKNGNKWKLGNLKKYAFSTKNLPNQIQI